MKNVFTYNEMSPEAKKLCERAGKLGMFMARDSHQGWTLYVPDFWSEALRPQSYKNLKKVKAAIELYENEPRD